MDTGDATAPGMGAASSPGGAQQGPRSGRVPEKISGTQGRDISGASALSQMRSGEGFVSQPDETSSNVQAGVYQSQDVDDARHLGPARRDY